MSEYYKAIRNTDWNYGGPNWKLSRSKIDLFMECPRCFYIDNKLGVSRPRGPSFTLNIAVDELLKKEFDTHRTGKTAHPLMKAYGVEAIPFTHKDLDKWRHNFTGIQYVHEKTGMLICGAIDDVWQDSKGNLIVVDYKATSKDGKIESLDDSKWQQQYCRQLEVYQWLLRKNKFNVADIGYFVYVNGKKDKEAFDGKLEFDVTLIAHKGNDSWVEKTLTKIKICLDDTRIPNHSKECDYCKYTVALGDVLREQAKSTIDIKETLVEAAKPKKPRSKKSKVNPETIELDIQTLF
jgi:CRISPR/Cas system-associated exonuclease Cas4 (RecB family)